MNNFFNLKFTLNGISDTFTLQGSIQLTEELLNGEEQNVEFQGADESGKIIFGGGGGCPAAAPAGTKCSIM